MRNSEKKKEKTKEKKNSGIFIIYLTYFTIIQSFNLIKLEEKNFQLKLFDIAVPFKYSKGHWKWYEEVKLNG